MKRIQVTIDPIGKATVEAIGFNGQGCVAATAGLEAVLGGGEIVARVDKPEIYNEAEQGEQNFMRY